MRATTIDHFANALAAFRGERFALDEHGCQALWFAFVPDAADLEVTPTHFHVRPAHHNELAYDLQVAPGVLGFLLERFGVVGPRSVRTWIAPTSMRVGRFPAWTSPARHVLAEAWTSRIAVRVRTREADLDDELPTRSEKKFLRLSHACPHCHVTPDRYRVLSDSALVCLACGASSKRQLR